LVPQTSDHQAHLKSLNLKEGKAMKTYVSVFGRLGSPGRETRAFWNLLKRAEKCREMVNRSSKEGARVVAQGKGVAGRSRRSKPD